MKLVFLIQTSFLFLVLGVSTSYSQSKDGAHGSLKSIDFQLEEQENNTNEKTITTDRLILQTPITKKDEIFYSKQEWQEEKNQPNKNSQKYTSHKNKVLEKSTVDTVYIVLPILDAASRLSAGKP